MVKNANGQTAAKLLDCSVVMLALAERCNVLFVCADCGRDA